MSRLKALLSKNCNYIYHMMAVANCGYDNEYGKKYSPYHSSSDLQTLKKHEFYITVSGGEHCGELYGLCVSIPSSFDDDTQMCLYFDAMLDMLKSDSLEQNFEKYKSIYETAFSSFGITIDIDSQREFYQSIVSVKQELTDILKILQSNYSVYCEKIWDLVKDELTESVDKLNSYLSQTDLLSEWERVLDYQYPHDYFYAVICNSTDNGPQCIDISYNKDVFGMPDDYPSAVQLISHEFGIYLLKDILSDTVAFKSFACYQVTESLAEYYNIIVCGGHSAWDWYKAEYMEFYQERHRINPETTTEEMFLQTVEHFKIEN